MRKIVVELDDATAARLRRLAPTARQRTDLVRAAVANACLEWQELRTAAAYARAPDAEPVYFDADAWEPRRPKASRRPGR